MGYMDLSVGGSDSAADLAYTMQNKMAKCLKRGLKDEGNQFNTDGVINVAMIFDEMIIPIFRQHPNDEIIKLAMQTAQLLEKKVKSDFKKDRDGEYEWDDTDAMYYHKRAYSRLLKRLRSFIEECGE